MNPSGDFGKRELSPALRNRFTEIWCTSITSTASLSSKYGQEFLFSFIYKLCKSAFVNISSDAQFLTNVSSAFNDLFFWVNVTWGDLLKPLSIRDLKSIIELAQGMWSDIQAASVFASVFLIIEGQLGISTTQLARMNMLSTVRDSLAKLFQKHPLLNDGLGFFQNLKLQINSEAIQINSISLNRCEIRRGPSPKTSSSANSYILTNQKVLSNLIRVMMGLKSQKAILLEGPPGVGKTSLVLHLGRLLNKKVHRINLNEQTDLIDLLGFDVPDPERPGTPIFSFNGRLLSMESGGFVEGLARGRLDYLGRTQPGFSNGP